MSWLSKKIEAIAIMFVSVKTWRYDKYIFKWIKYCVVGCDEDASNLGIVAKFHFWY